MLGAIIGTVGAELPLFLGAFVYRRLDRPQCDGEHVLDCLGEGIGEFLFLVVLILAVGVAMAIAGVLLATAGLGVLGKAKERVVDSTRDDAIGFVLIAGGTALGMPALWVIVLIGIEAVFS